LGETVEHLLQAARELFRLHVVRLVDDVEQQVVASGEATVHAQDVLNAR
jgi:hypothetical protein